MAERTYGELAGYPVGSTFTNRTDLSRSGVHRPNMNGIWGGKDGAESIVVSGGYVDDLDYGDEIIYTGEGGNDPTTKRQIADQQLKKGNVGLVRSQLDGNPVRVIRGSGGDPDWSPRSGLRYDGLFRVVDHWHETGKDGFLIWRFRLVSVDRLDAAAADEDATEAEAARRTSTSIQRIVRSSKPVREVKQWHDFRCQVCGIRLETPAGPYAEAAHIKPLGRPHSGPDIHANILCLCPNHHVLLDAGAIFIDETGVVRSTVDGTALSTLRTTKRHAIDSTYVKYHREHYGGCRPPS